MVNSNVLVSPCGWCVVSELRKLGLSSLLCPGKAFRFWLLRSELCCVK